MNASLLLVVALLNSNCPYVCKPNHALEVRLRLAQSQLEACPKMYVTRCINPAKARIEALKKQIEAMKGGK